MINTIETFIQYTIKPRDTKKKKKKLAYEYEFYNPDRPSSDREELSA